jgi:hypothetical protein
MCHNIGDLHDIINSPTTAEQEAIHLALLRKRRENNRLLNSSNSEETNDLSKT